jgi:extradiol dioxygenase family protein
MRPFHLAFPITDIEATRHFYGTVLGCRIGRESPGKWIDFDLFGHQMSAHLRPEMPKDTASGAVDGDVVPIPHFGVILAMGDFLALVERLEANPDIVGVFGANTFSAQGAGAAVQNAGLGGAVEVAAFDASAYAIELLREGTVTQVIAQKPGDMGYFAVLTAIANARGVVSIPKRWPTGYAIMNADNIDDPDIAKFIYREE